MIVTIKSKLQVYNNHRKEKTILRTVKRSSW